MPAKKKILLALLLFVTIISLLATYLIYLQKDQILIFNDSFVRLNIARRILDSKTPGLAQLGGVWLPVPSLLMFLTIYIDYFYFSGISGSIISSFFMILSVFAISGLTFNISKSYFSSLITGILYLLNLPLLYFSVIPMSESITIGFLIIITYLLSNWQKSNTIVNLIILSFSIFFGTLTRYELWFVSIAVLIIVAYSSYESSKSIKRLEAQLLLFSTLSFFGILIWILYNFAIFGDPLNFLHDEGATRQFVSDQVANGLQLTENDFLQSILIYTKQSIEISSLPYLILFITSFIYYIFKHKVNSQYISPFILFVPSLFHIYSLFSGQTFLVYRYGLYILPVASFFIGFLFTTVDKKNKLILSLFLAPFIIINLSSNPINPNLGETIYINQTFYEETQIIKKYIIEHPIEGDTLISSFLGGDTIIFLSRIQQNKIIYEGNQHLWQAALISPEKYAERIIVRKTGWNNTLYESIASNPDFKQNYKTIINGEYFIVYTKI